MAIEDIAMNMLNGAAAAQDLPQEPLKRFLQQLEDMNEIIGVMPMFTKNRQSGEFFYIQTLYVGDWHICWRRTETHQATKSDVELGAQIVFEQIQKETGIQICAPRIYARYAEATAQFPLQEKTNPPKYAELRIRLEQ